MDLIFWLRMLNMGLAIFVLVLCFIKMFWNDTDKYRRARILALGLIAGAVALGSYELRYEKDFSLRIPITTLSMAIAAYGMKGLSVKPETFKASRKSI